MNFFNGPNKKEFLENYWEKTPFVFRNVLSDPEALIDIKDIINMACDEYYESRLVSKDQDWQVEDGPFSQEQFKNKNLNWTLINHDLDLYLEKIAKLKQELCFLPQWLFDDVMSTYSTTGSSVGAHIDFIGII